MSRDELIARLKATEPVLRSFGVAALYLFGSRARGDARDDSDVDVFVDPQSKNDFGLRRYVGAYHAIEQAVSTHVDYGTRAGLHPVLREGIEREAIRVF